jgi:hypothetical protein
MTFSQSWARYQGVRDGWAAFAGAAYDGDYLRSQFDPSRDRATLKPANAMLASEGIAASVLFWTAAGLAEARGASPGGGLAQPSLVEAEEELLAAMAESTGTPGQFRPDLIDVVTAVGERRTKERQIAAVRFVEITHGVTARPGLRSTWKLFYDAAIALDQEQLRELFDALERERIALHDAVAVDPSVLRSGLGPILPVRAAAVNLEVKALGDAFPLEFDLNAATALEWQAMRTVEPEATRRILAERDARPFASLEDFEQRTGIVPSRVGLAATGTAARTQ